MRLGRGKLVFQRTSLVFLLRAGESRLSEKERSGFELRPVVKPSFIRRESGESQTHEQEEDCEWPHGVVFFPLQIPRPVL